MHDVVITVGTAIGSVLSLAEEIKTDTKCKVFVLCTDKTTVSIVKSSRFVDEVTFIKDNKNPEYFQSIKNWYKNKFFIRKPVLYSTTDTSCYLINEYREWYEQSFLLTLPSSEIIKTFTQKGKAESAAAQAGLAIPRTIVLNKDINLELELKKLDYPIILKPCATYMKGTIDFKIKVITTYDEALIEANKYITNGNGILCQEFIPNSNDAAYYYLFYRTQDGKVNSSMGLKTLQSTVNGGIMLKGKSYYVKELDDLCQSFLKKIDYVGIGGIEFKKYKSSFYFIEINARLEGIYDIANKTDVPLGLISYEELTNQSNRYIDKPIKQKNNINYIALLPTIITHLKSKDIAPFIADLLSALINPSYKIDVFSFKSPLPFFKQIYFTLFHRRK